MNKGVLLIGEPMGLLMAQNPGALDQVTGYSLAVAGAELNVAIGLTRLGHHAAYMTKLGPDPFGKQITHYLEEQHIATDFIRYSDERSTGFMLKGLALEGDPEIYYYRKNSAASTIDTADIDSISFDRYGLFHMTGIFPALSASTHEAAFYAMKKAREAGLTITFDPNLRPQLWPDTDTMVRTINELASLADYILPGQAEGKILCGSTDPAAIGQFYLDRGAKGVITKVGPQGAYVYTPDQQLLVPGFTVDKVVDTVGAGDGFAAGFISALLEELPLYETVRRANAIGAIQVTVRGDNTGLPTPDQLADFIKKQEKSHA